jgi:rubredoxin
MGGSRRKRIPTVVHCNKCGYEFEESVLFEKPRTANRSTVRGWVAVDKAPSGLKCPECDFVGAVVVVNPQIPD